MEQKLFKGQGKLFLARKVAGVAGAFKFAKNVTALTLT